MLLTLTMTEFPATDLGFLLRKHPERYQSFDVGFGTAHVKGKERRLRHASVTFAINRNNI